MDAPGPLIEAVDSHTAGEPTRIVTGGLPPIRGATMADKRAFLRDHHDALRRALVLEPRGHDAIVLAYLTEPVTPGAHTGVVFANDHGYLGMCGHGAIGVATVLVRLGKVAPRAPVTEVVLDTPAGVVPARVRIEGGKPVAAAIRNVPSFVERAGLTIDVPGLGALPCDIAWGGNWFAFVPVACLGLALELARLDALLHAAFAIRDALERQGIHGVDPSTGAAARIDHVKLFADESTPGQPATRALTLCPGRAWDRSPCGTGTSAKLALLAHRGELQPGETLLSRSILGTEFRARIAGTTSVQGRPAVVPEIEGAAWITGLQRFVLDPDDPLVHGFGRDRGVLERAARPR